MSIQTIYAALTENRIGLMQKWSLVSSKYFTAEVAISYSVLSGLFFSSGFLASSEIQGKWSICCV